MKTSLANQRSFLLHRLEIQAYSIVIEIQSTKSRTAEYIGDYILLHDSNAQSEIEAREIQSGLTIRASKVAESASDAFDTLLNRLIVADNPGKSNDKIIGLPLPIILFHLANNQDECHLTENLWTSQRLMNLLSSPNKSISPSSYLSPNTWSMATKNTEITFDMIVRSFCALQQRVLRAILFIAECRAGLKKHVGIDKYYTGNFLLHPHSLTSLLIIICFEIQTVINRIFFSLFSSVFGVTRWSWLRARSHTLS